MQKGEKPKEGASQVAKKPVLRPRKTVPEPCRSAATAADFFLPASRKRLIQKEALVQANAVASVEVEAADGDGDADADFASRKSKRPRKENAAPIVEEVTPKPRIRVRKSSQHTAKELPVVVGIPIVGLRAERKLAAEEDARRNAGKPLHPFFARRSPGMTKAGDLRSSRGPSTSPKNAVLLFPCPPLHVTQYEAVEPIQLDWGNLSWVGFSHKGTESCKRSEIPEALVLWRETDTALLALDRVIGHFSSVIISPNQQRCSRAEVGATGKPPHQNCAPRHGEDQLLRYLQNANLPFQEESWIMHYSQASSNGLSRATLKKRAASFKDCKKIGTFPANSLWTDIYQPTSPQDVCGNGEDIGFLNSWLESWQKKILCGGKSKENLGSLEESDGDDDKSWFQEDCSDDSASDSEDGLINTLLLTGPVGCGKTAAVYACAKAQGFSVIEVSTADFRNGALVKQKFGEALESHRLQTWSAGVNRMLRNGDSGSSQRRRSDCRASSKSIGLDGQKVNMSRPLTLILFEDVDVVFDEDRGFSSALAKLAATSKRPIILTSNKRCPALPVSLVKLTREFKQPCTQALVLHACMATAAEGLDCCPMLMECIVKACQHDMRQVMMVLQFWSQSRRDVSRLCAGLEVYEGSKTDALGLFHGKDACAGKGPNQSASSTSSQVEEIHWPGSKIEAHDFNRHVLLPLSFPSSLLWHVARKVSEAAWQLHLCASYAGVIGNQDPKIDGRTSHIEASATDSSNQKLTMMGKGWQAGNLSGDLSETVALREAGSSASAKSPRRVGAVACSMKSQRVSNICTYSESGSDMKPCLRQLRSQSATVETGIKSCWCKVPTGDSDCGHVCPDELGRAAEELIRCGDAVSGSRSSAAEISQSGKAKNCAEYVHNSIDTPETDGMSAPRRRRLCKLQDLKSNLQMCKADGRRRKLCKLRERETSRSRKNGGRKVAPDGRPTAGLMESSISVALSRQKKLTLKVNDPSATKGHYAELCCEESLALQENLESAFGQLNEVLSTGTAETLQSGDIQSALAVVATMARLSDSLSVFDTIISHSACELQASPLAESRCGFDSGILQDEAVYIADSSVRLCLEQCSTLVELGGAEKHTQQSLETGLTSLDWLGSDVNPCDTDHTMRGVARKGTLKKIVVNVLPKRTKAVPTSAALYDYTAGLALISKLENSRRAAAAAENGAGSRRTGRRFYHYLANSLAESDIACLLSHSEVGRGYHQNSTN